MALVPLIHRILVEPQPLEESNETYKRMNALGLAIPEHDITKKERQAVETGTILAIGETAFLDYKATMVPIVGDKVYYAKYAGKTVKDGDKNYLILNDEDIICIIQENV